MENKKVKNARKDFYDNIQFKSHLEVVVYKTLKKQDSHLYMNLKSSLYGMDINQMYYSSIELKRKILGMFFNYVIKK